MFGVELGGADPTGLQGNAKFISWFPHGLGKWENIFQSGNFTQNTGKMGKFYPKYWKSERIVANFYFSLCFLIEVYL